VIFREVLEPCEYGRLLARLFKREFAVADADSEAFRERGRRFLAVGVDELSKSGEQAGLRQAIAVDSIEARFGPGLLQIAERNTFLLAVAGGPRAPKEKVNSGAD
jgi:hypothetical protein